MVCQPLFEITLNSEWISMFFCLFVFQKRGRVVMQNLCFEAWQAFKTAVSRIFHWIIIYFPFLYYCFVIPSRSFQVHFPQMPRWVLITWLTCMTTLAKRGLSLKADDTFNAHSHTARYLHGSGSKCARILSTTLKSQTFYLSDNPHHHLHPSLLTFGSALPWYASEAVDTDARVQYVKCTFSHYWRNSFNYRSELKNHWVKVQNVYI